MPIKTLILSLILASFSSS